MTATEYVILVDEADNEIGLAEKLAAHQQNLLHRAFSVFIFSEGNNPQLLIQQRALSKYHSPGLWTNTCCSHPRKGEAILEAGKRRLVEELGIETELIQAGSFIYNAHFDNGLSEHELDHVLVGKLPANTSIKLNPDEISAYRWVETPLVHQELKTHPELFTPWFEEALAIAEKSLS